MSDLSKGVELVYQFNRNVGKAEPVSSSAEFVTTCRNQFERIVEEMQETLDALQKMHFGDFSHTTKKEFLDGVLDVMVTATGLAQIAEVNGYKVGEALVAVGENNCTKYTDDYTLAAQTAEHYASLDASEEYDVISVAESGNEWYSVHRVSDDKVMKLLGHRSPVLDSFVPLQ